MSIETGQSGLDCAVLDSLPDKQILLGVLDLSTEEVETVEVIKERVRRALNFVIEERVLLAPDCGMKYLSRQAAFGKLKAMAQAVQELREEFGR